MPTSRIVQILLASALITVISLVGHRNRVLGGIIASMPLMVPISLVIVFINTRNNYTQSAEFIRAAGVGLLGTGVFLLVAWWGLARRWPIWAVVLAGYLGWLAFVALSQWLPRFFVRPPS